MNLKRYLNLVRLHHARFLLRSGWSVKETVAEVGFLSTPYFCRLYRQYLHTTPKTSVV